MRLQNLFSFASNELCVIIDVSFVLKCFGMGTGGGINEEASVLIYAFQPDFWKNDDMIYSMINIKEINKYNKDRLTIE